MAETGKGLDLVRIRMAPDRTLTTQEPVSTPMEAVDFITREFGDLDREVFMILNLTCHLQVINMNICSMGTLNYTIVHPREVFKTSILSNASAVLLIHNHPSGILEPSKEDIDLTERMVSAGKILGIDVLDHLIIGTKERAYTSLRELGVMEFPERDWRELEQAADRQPEHTL
ncbi:MAG: JAB domain-containing protein [Porcincola intestinalis]|uniref:JAB domain-containing protein n=1 Tax=Porcincola intestinalis TaxID=2606632 RepID=UPI002A914DAE|nr:JAB domain-containing protein [Porcincola intestinalis]MDY5331681.1 JAB domain-containing protein [Porcincola intestinalis]